MDTKEALRESEEFEAELESLEWYDKPVHWVVEADGALKIVHPEKEDDGESVPEKREDHLPGTASVDFGREYRFPRMRDSEILERRTALIVDAARKGSGAMASMAARVASSMVPGWPGTN